MKNPHTACPLAPSSAVKGQKIARKPVWLSVSEIGKKISEIKEIVPAMEKIVSEITEKVSEKEKIVSAIEEKISAIMEMISAKGKIVSAIRKTFSEIMEKVFEITEKFLRKKKSFLR